MRGFRAAVVEVVVPVAALFVVAVPAVSAPGVGRPLTVRTHLYDGALSNAPARLLAGGSPGQSDSAQRARATPSDGNGPVLAALVVADFRVNQQQVDINGTRVGVSRPDLQYTLDGQRFYEEFDTSLSGRGAGHAERIGANDPWGIINLFTVP